VVTKDGWLGQKSKHLYTVAGAAHLCKFALCFPFNRRHDYVSEHQNSGILAFNRWLDKVGLLISPTQTINNIMKPGQNPPSMINLDQTLLVNQMGHIR
jgi:hypothetical protein